MFAALVLSALLAQSGSPALTIYIFTTTDCPVSNRYVPEIQRLAAKFAAQAKFVLVYPVPGDSPAKIDQHRKKFGLDVPYVRDSDQKLVKMTGVTVTPEVALMKGAELIYRGRIDDRYMDLGKDRPAPTRRDLELAIDAAVAGRTVAIKETRAVGCFIADLIR